MTLLDHGPVLFRQDQGIARLSRPAFAELARDGVVSGETVVFDNTLTRVADLRERPVGNARARLVARRAFA